MEDLIQIEGLRVLAHCGASQDERDRYQPFEININIQCDLETPGISDELNDTADYEKLVDVILRILSEEHFSLMEKMANRIISELFDTDSKIQALDLSLKKLRPPVQADVASAGVKIRRIRK